MKKLIGLSSLLMFLLFMLQTGVSSCSKDQTIYKTDTVVVTKRDTVIIKDTAITLQLLTANSWKMQEIRGVQGNNLLYYKRGGTGNTESFDAEYITFNANKTGLYLDGAGYSHQLTWDFSNSENTKITFTMENPAPLASHTVVYDNLRYKNGALFFDQYWTFNNVHSHAQVIRTPR
jgi:hypothetical protein